MDTGIHAGRWRWQLLSKRTAAEVKWSVTSEVVGISAKCPDGIPDGKYLVDNSTSLSKVKYNGSVRAALIFDKAVITLSKGYFRLDGKGTMLPLQQNLENCYIVIGGTY
ncbi:hypothetical protein ACJJTC_000248 [Scirpophaga incertulas]